LRHSAFAREEGDETLADLANEFGMSLGSIYGHAKKHMKDRSEQSAESRQAKLAKKTIIIQAEAHKELEIQLDKQTVDDIEARPNEIIGLDEYIAQGIADVKAGNMKMTPSSFLAAVKIKTEWSSKQTSNKIELMRTMYAFSSGNKKKEEKNDRTTREITASSDGGEDESTRIYRAAFGDATPQGAEEVHSDSTSPR